MAEDRLTSEDLEAGSRCVYCGVLAECRDHVVPVAYSHITGRRKAAFKNQKRNLVPACNECNRLAGSNVFAVLDDKRAFIRGALSVKYKKILDFPIWPEDEIAELSPKLRRIVRLKLSAKHVMQNRLDWPNVSYDEFKDAREIWALLASLLRES